MTFDPLDTLFKTSNFHSFILKEIQEVLQSHVEYLDIKSSKRYPLLDFRKSQW